jgi:divinyl protochlorophyllide a 8-vinyl-reductase
MHRTDDSARIGPNAVIQLRDVLAETLGDVRGAQIFDAAGQSPWWRTPPTIMVPEAAVRAVHKAVVDHLGAAEAQALLAEAGARTGAYLLANRIPGLVRWLFPRLPALISARLLIRAVARHAWTFCGSGEFRYGFRRGLDLTVRHNPLAVLGGDPWHRAVFETLFRRLVSPACIVRPVVTVAARADDSAFLVLGPGFGL